MSYISTFLFLIRLSVDSYTKLVSSRTHSTKSWTMSKMWICASKTDLVSNLKSATLPAPRVSLWWQLPCYAMPCRGYCLLCLVYLSVRLAIMWRLSLLWKMPLSLFPSPSLSVSPHSLSRPTSAFINGHCGLRCRHFELRVRNKNWWIFSACLKIVFGQHGEEIH